VRILNVNMSLDPVIGAGTAERTLQLSRHLVPLGNECTILTVSADGAGTLATSVQGERLRLVALPCINQRFYVPRFQIKDLHRLVDDTDIVHIMGHWTFLNAIAAYVSRARHRPYVVCPAGALPVFGRSRILKHGYNLLVGYRNIRKASAHVAIADNEIAHYAAYGITPERITMIPNGVNPRDYQQSDVAQFRRQAGLGTAPYILFVGRLNLIKGPDLLLKAFFEITLLHRVVHLVFAGPDGGMEAQLKGMVGEVGMRERVHFTGYVGGADKTAAYQGASFIVVPSRQEAMSIVVLEAGICGKAVLMTDQCGFSTTGRTDGVQVVTPTVAGIREGLLEMLQDDASTKEMGERFRQCVTENYTWDIAARRYLSLFEQILQDGHA
jgi:glycosyltransferase involved in cell wall biosynthesis